MVIFGYSKEKIEDLESQIRRLKADLEILHDRFMTLKGYVYAKKVHIEPEKTQEEQENLNNPILPIENYEPFKRFR